MLNEQPLWTEEQIDALDKDIEQATQAVVELFPSWLQSQHPANDRPDTIGEFKHKMLNKIGGNLKTLGLDDQVEQLKERVNYLVANAEIAAEARQLIRDVNNWVYEHNEVSRIPRVSDIRGLKDVAKGYANKLRGMSQRIEMQELQDTRANLAEFTETLKATEAKIMNRANDLWDSKISSEEDLGAILKEVKSLMTAFEGLDTDLEDMDLMEKALKLFQKGCNRLSQENITWDEFDSILSNWQKEMLQALGEEELPWDIEETISILSAEKSGYREKMSSSWITELQNSWNSMKSPTTSELNSLHEKAATPPPYLTDDHREIATQILTQIEDQLEALKVEWLIEKFKEMPYKSQEEFIETILSLYKEATDNHTKAHRH